MATNPLSPDLNRSPIPQTAKLATIINSSILPAIDFTKFLIMFNIKYYLLNTVEYSCFYCFL